jgi:aldehyde:ferredoxin oxidoreductase
MSQGYMGKVLKVNLESGQLEDELIPDEVYEGLLSGIGLAAWILNRDIPRGADPLGPDNVLGIVSGILTATGAQMADRWMAVGKSPLTGGWGDANAGGNFSPAIKRAGYDGVFFKGVSDKPVYLRVTDGKAELVDASPLWGLDTVETEDRIKKESGTGNMRVVCIGAAGEKQSLISGIVNDGGRIAARSGLGAVMGSKKLKAVAFSGKSRPAMHDPETVQRLSKGFAHWVKSGDRFGRLLPPGITHLLAKFLRHSPVAFRAGGSQTRVMLRKYGTVVNNLIASEIADAPIRNWKGTWKDYPLLYHSRRLAPERILAHQTRRYHCSSCPLGCGGKLDFSPDSGIPLVKTHKPEYETCAAFGSLILNNDLEALFVINDLLNRAGMDTISAGSTVAFAMECFEKGILGPEDTDGFNLSWGNAEATISVVKKMIAREGIGDLLADGSAKAAQRIGKGAWESAMHAGGQDLPMHDLRLDPAFGVGYSMEPTPGRHSSCAYVYNELYRLHEIFPDLPPTPLVYRKSSRLSVEDKQVLLSASSKFLQLANASGVCQFALQMGPDYPFIAYLNAVTGWNRRPEDYLEVGSRIQQLRQAFNLRQGKVPARDFRPPKRTEGDPPLTTGPLKGAKAPLDELNRNFAKAMGWDDEGKPLPETLRALGLDEVAKDIEQTSLGGVTP